MLQMDARVFVSRESDEPYLTRLACLQRGLDGAPFKNPVGIVVVIDFVELPKVQVVSLQAGAGCLPDTASTSCSRARSSSSSGRLFFLYPIGSESFAHDLLGTLHPDNPRQLSKKLTPSSIARCMARMHSASSLICRMCAAAQAEDRHTRTGPAQNPASAGP